MHTSSPKTALRWQSHRVEVKNVSSGVRLGLNPNTVIYSETLGKLFINDFELLFGVMEITTYTL